MGYTAEMSGEPKRIHIVEPTLSSEAGHCHSFVESVCAARREGDGDITLYAGSRARLPRIEGMGVRVVPYFHRRIRRPEAFLLYRKLLRGAGTDLRPHGGQGGPDDALPRRGTIDPSREGVPLLPLGEARPVEEGFFQEGERQAAGPHPDGADGNGRRASSGSAASGTSGSSRTRVRPLPRRRRVRRVRSGTCCSPGRRGGTRGSRRWWISSASWRIPDRRFPWWCRRRPDITASSTTGSRRSWTG